jgi:hypothetical protein
MARHREIGKKGKPLGPWTGTFAEAFGKVLPESIKPRVCTDCRSVVLRDGQQFACDVCEIRARTSDS